ncbi:hypothetical protein [Halioglobus sp. Uisw_031]|uniref:hypothetical protein n=1 Tax=Halioglobus sp. Uisw_031 TaxID=3230977 RepID=UPI0039ED4CAE
MDKAFGKTDEGLSLFSSAVNYIYGGGGVVTNCFSIDLENSRIYMPAAAAQTKKMVQQAEQRHKESLICG